MPLQLVLILLCCNIWMICFSRTQLTPQKSTYLESFEWIVQFRLRSHLEFCLFIMISQSTVVGNKSKKYEYWPHSIISYKVDCLIFWYLIRLSRISRFLWNGVPITITYLWFSAHLAYFSGRSFLFLHHTDYKVGCRSQICRSFLKMLYIF